MDTDIPATVSDTAATRITAAITGRHFIGITVTEFIIRGGIITIAGIGANRRAEVS